MEAQKLNFNGLEHLSVSNINLFRRNSLQWFLKYIKGVETKYPSIPMIRGKAIEAGIVYALENNCDDDTRSAMALKAYIKELMPSPDFQDTLDSVDYHNLYLNNHEMKKLDPILPLGHISMDEYEKGIAFVYEATQDYRLRSFEPLRSQKPRFQNRVLSVLEGTDFPILGYTDIEYDNIGIEIKTTNSLPKTKEDISLDHLLQIAFYATQQNKKWRIIYITKPTSESLKSSFIYYFKNGGKSDKEIIENLKKWTGSGTTSDFIKKVMESPRQYIKDNFIEFDFEPQELDKYYFLLRRMVGAMINLIKKDEDEILEHCIASYNPSFSEPLDIEAKIEDLLYF